MQWAWKGYREFAWGEDELLPHSHTSHRWFGLGLTLVDSLDTLHVMGLEEELSDAREWVARNLMLDQVGVDPQYWWTACTIASNGATVCPYLPPAGMPSVCCAIVKTYALSIQLDT